MTATTITELDLLRARMSGAIGAQMPGHIQRLGWGPGQLAAFQRDRLRALLVRAIERSPFHAARLRGVDPDRFELADLSRLPIMTKTEMMANFDAAVTSPRLTRNLVEQHLARSAVEPSLLLGEYVCLVSGGSSGLRGIFAQTVSEYADFVCTIMRRPMAAVMTPAGPPPEGLVFGIVGAGSPIHSSGLGAATATAPPLRMIPAPAGLPIAEIVRRLNAAQPPALLAYGAKLAELAREQRTGRLRLSLVSVTSMAEAISPAERDAIGDAFGVPVTDLFVCTEGLVGRSDPGSPVLTFASDMCLAECVDDEGRPVPDGVTSSKVLVTNLHNLTQPLIRYELTDRFTPAGWAGQGVLRARVEGRADDLFRYPGANVHPFVIGGVLLRAPAVREFQVRQTGRGADVAAVIDGTLDLAALGAEVEDRLGQAGLTASLVTIRPVAALDRDPLTGKARRFIPLGTDRSTSEMTAKIHATKIPVGLQQTLDRVHAATVAIGQGDPEPYMRLWSRADDVTVFGAWGPCKRGWDELSQAFRWVSARFGGGELCGEEVIVTVSGDLAYTVGYERGAMVVDGGEPQPMSIRVTHIFRNEDGDWHLVHRHADFAPIDQSAGKLG